MTNKEAIEIIKAYKERLTSSCSNQLDEDICAFDLAIKALMAYRDCRHCTHNVKIGNMRGCELGDCDYEDMRKGDKE